MSSKIVKALKKVRGKHVAPKRESTRDKMIAKYYGRKYIDRFWQRDKKTVQMANFKKALHGLEKYREAQQAEKDRLAEIKKVRLENLAKARKAKRRKK